MHQPYTIHQLARLAEISVRTLHWYDKIGLLEPAHVGANGYRYYGDAQLVRLQQILFFRELEFSLEDIRAMLAAKDFDEVRALQDHLQLLKEKRRRLNRLLQTVTETIRRKKGTKMATDEQLYEGFSKKEIETMKREVKEKYDPKLVAESNRRVKSWSKADWQMIKKEGGLIYQGLAPLIHEAPDHPEVQVLIRRHHRHMNRFYDCTLEIYRGLGDLYVHDPRFTAFYEKIQPGLAVFVREAILIYTKDKSGLFR